MKRPIDRKQRLWLTVAIAAAWCLAACDDSTSPTEPTTEEEEVEVATVTETFDGSLRLGETSCHDFVTTEVGDVELTITDLEPLGTLTLGMGVGVPDEAATSGCSLFAADQSVRLGDILLSSQLAVAEYCLCVYDVGNIFAGETVTYSIDVTHP
jgi:hypothetical protein